MLPAVHAEFARSGLDDALRGSDRSNVDWCSCCQQMAVTYCCNRCKAAERRQRLAVIANDVCRCCVYTYGPDAQRCCILCDIFGGTAVS